MSSRFCLPAAFSFCVIILCASAFGRVPPDSVVVPPIETFMQIGSATSPQITQDGDMVFFRTSMSGVDQVYKFLPSGWPYQLTVFEDGIDFYKASRSGEGIVIGASAGGSEQSDLYLLDPETGVISTLKAAEDIRHAAPVWSPDGDHLYFSSNEDNPRFFFIYRMRMEDGAIERIWDKEAWSSVDDVSLDGKKLLVAQYYTNVNNDLYLLDPGTGEETLITEHEGDCSFEHGRLSPDAGTAYFVTNMNEDGISRVARKEVGSGGIEFLNPTTPWETEEMDLSPDGRLLAWVENVEGYGELYLLDLETGSKIEVSELRGIVSSLDLSGEGTAVFVFSSASMPPDIWQYDVETGGLEKLTHSTFAGVDAALFIEPELVRYESFDGLKIPAFLYLPPDWDGKPIPFVVHAHGGPESQFRPSFVRHFQYLALNGYGIIAPNIRGSSGYGLEYIKLDDYRKRKDSIRDLYHAAEWLAEKGYSRFGRIGIKGASYGGYAALAALVDYPDVFGAGIDHIGIANFVTFLKNTKLYRRSIREAEYGPLSDEKFLREISPLTHAERIRAPLLVVHGENDTRVPVGEARQIAEAVQGAGGVAETLIFPDEGHGVAKLSNRLVYYRKMVEFLDEHLKD
jgi:dipeptidyl aminopeptidase/acylaminoacyl peptidase